MIAQGAILCLALNIYHESRGEPIKGQIAVANVTMNRANGDLKNVCQVVYAPRQFSWTHQPKAKVKPSDKDASWRKAKTIAQQMANGHYADNTSGAEYFHTHQVEPAWRKSVKKTVVIGNHIFYAKL